MIKRLQDHRLGGYDPWNPRRIVEVEVPKPEPPAPPQKTQAEKDAEREAIVRAALLRQEEKVRSLAEAAAIQRAAKKFKAEAKAGARGSVSRRPPTTESREETGIAAEGEPVETQSSGAPAKRKGGKK